MRRIEAHRLQIETPAGWTGGGAGGTYEFHSPDGTGRVRIAGLEGVSGAVGLKESQLLAGTGATVVKRLLPTSPVKIGVLMGERIRVATSDQRVYEVIALAVPVGEKKAVVLIQASVSADHAEKEPAAADGLFTMLRQSIRPLGASSGPD
ncbi:MAG: hypothetical protein NZX77_03725 [Polyangiaceae bacterium]|nr:hypothetical protein [Polyangiaceae bacterium]